MMLKQVLYIPFKYLFISIIRYRHKEREMKVLCKTNF